MLPYISVYFIHIGLSVWQVGILRSLEPILTFIGSPLWGAFADRYSKHRLATSIAISGAGVVYFIFLFVPLMTGVSPDSLLQEVTENCAEDTTDWNNYHLMCDDAALVDRQGVWNDARGSNVSLECTDMCAAGMLSKNHNSKFSSCLREVGGWKCSPCPGTENRPSADIPKGTLTLYGISCPSPTGYSVIGGAENVTEFDIQPSVQRTEKNISSSCLQSACCQCATKNFPNPRQGITFAICIVFSMLGVAFNCNTLMFFDSLTMELIKGKSEWSLGLYQYFRQNISQIRTKCILFCHIFLYGIDPFIS